MGSDERRVVPAFAKRHRMPTRRSITGAILITVAAAGVLTAHRSATSPPTDRYVVVTRAVPAGHRLESADLGTVAMDLPRGVAAIGAADAEQLVGRVARTPLDELSLLRPADLFEGGRFTRPGSVEVAVELPPARALTGTISAGDVVDVLATDREATDTRVVVTGAEVSEVEDGSRDGIGTSGTVRVRLGLPDRDAAIAVVDASVRSEVSLVLPAPRPEETR